MTADHLEDRDLALALHKVLSDIDPARWREETAAALRAKLREVQAMLARRRARHPDLAGALDAELPALEAPDKGAWLAFKQRAVPLYVALAAQLRAEHIHVPSLRPTNYARNLFHVGSAAVAAALILWVSSPSVLVAIAVAWAGFAWSCEVSRRLSPAVNRALMRFFGPVAHPHETFRVNSATWYATALLALSLTRSDLLCVVGVVVLGVGDPLAALVGRRFGRIRLVHGRSLEGTLAFAVGAALATFAVLATFFPALGLPRAAAVAASGAVLGAVAELFSLRVDDNLSIPLSAAAGAALAAWLLGAGLA